MTPNEFNEKAYAICEPLLEMARLSVEQLRAKGGWNAADIMMLSNTVSMCHMVAKESNYGKGKENEKSSDCNCSGSGCSNSER